MGCLAKPFVAPLAEPLELGCDVSYGDESGLDTGQGNGLRFRVYWVSENETPGPDFGGHQPAVDHCTDKISAALVGLTGSGKAGQ